MKATVFRLEREQEDMANNRLKLTQTNVQRLIRAHDGSKKVRHWDTEVPKLFLAITPNGSAAYKLQIVKPDGSKTDAKLIAANDGALPHRGGPPVLLVRRFPRSGVHSATSSQ